MADVKLTDKQKRFCDEYLISLNATQAAIKAGYSPKGMNKRVTRLTSNEGIKNYINERMAAKEQTLIATQDEILKYLTSVLRGESLSTEIVIEGTGEGCSIATTMKKEPSEKERLKAAELLGKRFGTFNEQTEKTTIQRVQIVNDLPKDDYYGTN